MIYLFEYHLYEFKGQEVTKEKENVEVYGQGSLYVYYSSELFTKMQYHLARKRSLELESGQRTHATKMRSKM